MKDVSDPTEEGLKTCLVMVVNVRVVPGSMQITEQPGSYSTVDLFRTDVGVYAIDRRQ